MLVRFIFYVCIHVSANVEVLFIVSTGYGCYMYQITSHIAKKRLVA